MGPPDADPRKMSAIAEVELTGLPLEDAVLRMLDVIRRVLGVDTAVVLLTDATGTHLEAFAAQGLEEEVRQGYRMPVGGGFAGRIAASRGPAVLDEVHADAVLNPLLLHKGLRSMSGVPLVVGSSLLGVLHVGSLSTRHFDDDDLGLLQLAGERIAHVILADQTTADRTTAWMLQRSLLPGRLPDVDDMEFSSRFVPARSAGVGGDWFDAFTLPGGGVGIVMGDVVGSGLRAAVIMGRLRSALRAYALEFPDPAVVVDRLNRKIMHFEPGQMATVLYLIVAADRTSLTLSSAGHPPPLAARPDQEATFLDCHPSPPVGVERDGEHVAVTHRLEPGMTVAVYTDGLYERRTEPIDEQLERLRRSVYAGPPRIVASDIMSEMIGTHVVGDDTALLVFRRVR
jgi:sigma-B regulation protein RsbU (phosphoserine phosphatase)